MKKILIIGLGLIGGSFARALRQYKVSDTIFAFDENFSAIEEAKSAGIIEDFADLDENLYDFDLIVIATPLAAYKKILTQISKTSPSNAVVIDLGSLKEFVVAELPKNLQQNFVACHPIAGSDKTGFENSFAELFLEKKFVICPHKNCNEIAVKEVAAIIEKIGAKVDFIEPKQHDKIYALVSHLPQFLSFLTKEFSPFSDENNFANSLLQNAFRLDNSSAEIWEDIFKLNEKNLEKFYLEFFDNLEEFVTQIKQEKFAEIVTELKNIVLKLGAPKLTSQDFEASIMNDKNSAAKILFRLIIVASYLKIAEIKNLQNYAGSGFRDFTSIIYLVELAPKLAELLKQNQKEILLLIKNISE